MNEKNLKVLSELYLSGGETWFSKDQQAALKEALDALSPSEQPEPMAAPLGWVKRINENHPIGLTQPGDWRFTPHKPTMEDGLKAEWFDVQPLYTQPSKQTGASVSAADIEALLKKHDPNGEHDVGAYDDKCDLCRLMDDLRDLAAPND